MQLREKSRKNGELCIIRKRKSKSDLFTKGIKPPEKRVKLSTKKGSIFFSCQCFLCH